MCTNCLLDASRLLPWNYHNLEICNVHFNETLISLKTDGEFVGTSVYLSENEREQMLLKIFLNFVFVSC